MEMVESALDKETIDFDGEDVEMADADAYTEEIPIPDSPAAGLGVGGGGGAQAEKGGPAGKKKKKKSGRKKNRGRLDGPPTKIADINRVVVETWNGYFHERVMPIFVLDTCRRLKEKKSYLVWNAIGCLGVSAVSDLVREVEAIQKCGGQMIADGSRFRTGGGILWNILKSREPKAYKEIIVKGRELEKKFMYGKGRPHMSRNEDASSQGSALVDEEIEAQDDAEHLVHVEEAPHNNNKAEPRKPVADRIRVPVSYDDLFEEGEMHEEEPQI